MDLSKGLLVTSGDMLFLDWSVAGRMWERGFEPVFMLTLFNLLYQRARRLTSEETGIPTSRRGTAPPCAGIAEPFLQKCLLETGSHVAQVGLKLVV